MDHLVIEGGVPLNGSIAVAGAKNAALPILAATLLCEGECRIEGVPDLRDIRTMLRLLTELGCEVSRDPEGTISVCVRDETAHEAPYDIVKEMRASFCVLGPLIARRGKAIVSMPGGCNLGLRPIDLHLKGLRAMGARIDFEQGYVLCRGLLEDHWLARMRDAYQRAVERSRAVAASNQWFSLQPAHSAAAPRINRIERLPDQDPAFWDVAVNSRAADLAADVVGPDVIYRDSMINVKCPGSGGAVTWHQDLPFYPHTNVGTIQVLTAL